MAGVVKRTLPPASTSTTPSQLFSTSARNRCSRSTSACSASLRLVMSIAVPIAAVTLPPRTTGARVQSNQETGLARPVGPDLQAFGAASAKHGPDCPLDFRPELRLTEINSGSADDVFRFTPRRSAIQGKEPALAIEREDVNGRALGQGAPALLGIAQRVFNLLARANVAGEARHQIPEIGTRCVCQWRSAAREENVFLDGHGFSLLDAAATGSRSGGAQRRGGIDRPVCARPRRMHAPR